MIVLDASAAVEMLLSTPAGHSVARRLGADQSPIHTPHLLSVEVVSALRRLAAGRAIATADGHEALQVLAQLDVRRWPHEPLLRRVWSLRGHVTAYDAVYVALAEALEAPLITTDRRLARSKGHDAQIELITA